MTNQGEAPTTIGQLYVGYVEHGGEKWLAAARLGNRASAWQRAVALTALGAVCPGTLYSSKAGWSGGAVDPELTPDELVERLCEIAGTEIANEGRVPKSKVVSLLGSDALDSIAPLGPIVVLQLPE